MINELRLNQLNQLSQYPNIFPEELETPLERVNDLFDALRLVIGTYAHKMSVASQGTGSTKHFMEEGVSFAEEVLQANGFLDEAVGEYNTATLEWADKRADELVDDLYNHLDGKLFESIDYSGAQPVITVADSGAGVRKITVRSVSLNVVSVSLEIAVPDFRTDAEDSVILRSRQIALPRAMVEAMGVDLTALSQAMA